MNIFDDEEQYEVSISAFEENFMQAVREYTHGSCLLLAYEIARKTNNLVGVVLTGGCHAFALTNDKEFAIDINGIILLEDMLVSWNCTSEEDFQDNYSHFDISCDDELYYLKYVTNHFRFTLEDILDKEQQKRLDYWSDYSINNYLKGRGVLV